MRMGLLILMGSAFFLGTPTATSAEETRAMKKGAVIGLISGAVAFPTAEIIRLDRVCGPYRGTLHACDDEPRRSTVIFRCGALGAAVGAGIGAAIGRMFDRRRERRIIVAPEIGRARKSLSVSVNFR